MNKDWYSPTAPVGSLNPGDVPSWGHRFDFENKLKKWCRNNNIGFFGTYVPIDLESKNTKLVVGW